MATINLKPENKKILIEEIKDFFKETREEELSTFQAENYLEFMLDKAGVYIYNQAIVDAQIFMTAKTEELFVLEKQYKKPLQ